MSDHFPLHYARGYHPAPGRMLHVLSHCTLWQVVQEEIHVLAKTQNHVATQHGSNMAKDALGEQLRG